MIVGAFAAGDLSTLRRLLAPEVLANFEKAIRDRVAAEQTMTTTLVSIDSASVVEARLAGTVASVAVRFAAKLVVGDARQGGRGGRRLAQRRRRPSRRLDVHPRRRGGRPQLVAGGDADGELRRAPAPWRRSRNGARRDAAAATSRFRRPCRFRRRRRARRFRRLSRLGARRRRADAAVARGEGAVAAADARRAGGMRRFDRRRERRAALLRRKFPPVARRLRSRRRRRLLHRLLRTGRSTLR